MAWLSRSGRAHPTHARRTLPGLEKLEDRLTPSVTVTTPLDVNNPGSGQLTLRQAIALVNAGQVADNTVILPGGVYQDVQGALNVTHSLILQGAGANSTILDGLGKDRVIFVDPSAAVNVQITGVTLRNGATSGNGGGIEVQDVSGQSSTLTVSNSIITGNSAATATSSLLHGGGLDNENGDITVLNSQITNNQVLGADDWGGGIADAALSTGNITVTNSLIAGNSAGSGGGIGLVSSHSGKLTVTGSIIRGNTLTANVFGGGGIFIDFPGTVAIHGSTIRDNSTLGDGGGIDIYGIVPASVLLSNDTITDNQSTQGNGGGLATTNVTANLTLQGCTISGNSAALSGGGLSGLLSGNLTLTGCVFMDNQARGTGAGQGGGGLLYAGTSASTLSIQQSFFNDNSANLGGGLLLSDTAATANILNSTFSANAAATMGGGIEDQAATLTAKGSIFDNNQARDGDGGALDVANGTNQTVTLTSDTLRANSAAGGTGLSYGGALYDGMTGSSVSVVFCLVSDNTAQASGGGIEQAEGKLFLSASQLTGNAAAVDGGALDFNASNPLTILASTFNNNHAGLSGGAFYYNSGGSGANLLDDTFTGNTAVNNGGGLDVVNGPLAFYNTTINGNMAGGTGGGVSDDGTGTHSFQNTIVAGNSAGGTGPDVFTATGLSVTDNGGNFLGTLSGAAGFGAGTLTSNPMLGTLQNNGGQLAGVSASSQIVSTEALLLGSHAIGAGVASSVATFDECGFVRPGVNNPKLSPGAYEPQFVLTSANAVYVENLYETLFHRSADPGAGNWVSFLDRGGSPVALVQALTQSAEYRGDEVQALYQQYLHRAADSDGLQNFVNFLEHGGTVEQVAEALIGSGEYFDLYGDSNETALHALYEDALNRMPDPVGEAGFLQALNSGAMSLQQVAAAIFGSQEYHTDLVETDFQSYLGRTADAGGLAAFVGQLQAGVSDEVVLADILGSGEAYAKRS